MKAAELAIGLQSVSIWLKFKLSASLNVTMKAVTAEPWSSGLSCQETTRSAPATLVVTAGGAAGLEDA